MATTPRTRTRSLKTWSAFGDLGRRPSEYEILTHNLNHTATGPIPLEMGPDTHGNRWLREHRDSMRLVVADWDAFRDPDQITYGSYVAMQDDQETYVEGLYETFDREGYDEKLGDEALDLLQRALTPGRYLGHGLQMLSSYVQQLAVSSYVGNCAAFQTADQLRRVQTTAYRTTALKLTHEDRDFGTGERARWEGDEAWQGIRQVVEKALVEYDWDRAFVFTQLTVKPIADFLLLEALSKKCRTVGAELDALILENLFRDSRRCQRWTTALVKFLEENDAKNLTVLQEYLDEAAPLGQEAVAKGAALLDPANPEAVAAQVTSSWSALLEQTGLRLPA